MIKALKKDRAGCLAAAVCILLLGLHFHALLTAPLNDVLWGISISADPIGDLSAIHELWRSWQLGCLGHSVVHNVPFGALMTPNWHGLTNVAFVAFGLILALTKKLILSFNLTVVMVFVGNYAVIYWASRKLLRDPVLALIPAVLITFSAYAYAHSWAHLGLLTTFYFAAFLYTYSRLQETGRTVYVLASAVLMALSLYASPYYFYMMGWTALSVIVGYLWVNPRGFCTRQRLLGNVCCVLCAIVLVIPFVCEVFWLDYEPYWQQSMGKSDYGQNLFWLLNYSARPLDYILPNTNNAFWGEYFAQFITDATRNRNMWSDEFAISIGLVPSLFLAATLLVLAAPLWGKRASARLTASPFAKAMLAVKAERPELFRALLIIMVAAFLLSLPPFLTLGEHKVYLPNEALRYLVPLRSYSRFALLFLTALSLFMALVARHWRHGRLLAVLLILGCGIENLPRTMLHPASTQTPYIAYLRQRPESVLTRFEQQNIEHKRALDLEVLLSGKETINGDINLNFGYTDWSLRQDLPRFNMGYIGAMGAQLLLVSGHLTLAGKEQPYLELLQSFPESDVEIWKIKPTEDERMLRLMAPFIQQHQQDVCYNAPKNDVMTALRAVFSFSQ